MSVSSGITSRSSSKGHSFPPQENSNGILTPATQLSHQPSISSKLSINKEERVPRILPFPSRLPVERRKPVKYIFPNIGQDVFSSHHPMIPKHYVPPWQLDMKNRYRILENCQSVPGKTCWGGHISYFWEGRERLNATSHKPYHHIVDGSMKKCFTLPSHLSRYNPSQMYYI